MADFGRNGRRHSFVERFSEALVAGRDMSGLWPAVRWIVIALFAALLLFGGVVLAKFAGSVIDGALPFIDKFR